MPGNPHPRDPFLPKPKRKSPPYPFVLEALAPLQPEVRPMFSAHAIYTQDKLILWLRDSPKSLQDNGLWLVLSEDGFSEFALAENTSPSDKTLKREFPSLRPIALLSGQIQHWLLIPSDSPNFEQEAQHACDLLLAHDPRLGRIPKSRQSKTKKRP
jgi:hypothetical protein